MEIGKPPPDTKISSTSSDSSIDFFLREAPSGVRSFMRQYLGVPDALVIHATACLPGIVTIAEGAVVVGQAAAGAIFPPGSPDWRAIDSSPNQKLVDSLAELGDSFLKCIYKSMSLDATFADSPTKLTGPLYDCNITNSTALPWLHQEWFCAFIFFVAFFHGILICFGFCPVDEDGARGHPNRTTALLGKWMFGAVAPILNIDLSEYSAGAYRADLYKLMKHILDNGVDSLPMGLQQAAFLIYHLPGPACILGELFDENFAMAMEGKEAEFDDARNEFVPLTSS